MANASVGILLLEEPLALQQSAFEAQDLMPEPRLQSQAQEELP